MPPQLVKPLFPHITDRAPHHTTTPPTGMDTRPWRLPLPPSVDWFEVDKPDVLAAKTSTLQRAGVQLRGRSQDALSALLPHTFNLAAAKWSGAAVDLQVVGWTAQLELQGLDLLQPTCWVGEGLLYYLHPSTVTAMLRVRVRVWGRFVVCWGREGRGGREA